MPPLSPPGDRRRLEAVVRRERRKPRRQRALAADQNPDRRGAQTVICEPSGHASEVREGVHIEEADLVLPLIHTREVAARVHQPHQKEPPLASRTVDVDEYLEEIDLREIAGPMRQRDKHLRSLPLPLGEGLLSRA
jgi:hypothetical protein